MRTNLRSLLCLLAIGFVTVSPAWGQETPEIEEDSAEAGQVETENAIEAERDADESASQEARDRRSQETPRAVESARDREASQPTRDAVRETRESTRDAARDATEATRDATRNARETAREAAESARDARSVELDARMSAQNFRVDDVRAPDYGLWFERSTNQGLVISDVATAGAIAELGFQAGDRIVSVNGQRVVNEAAFSRYLFAPEIRNERVKVIVLRDGREEIVYVQPAVLIREMSVVAHDPLEEFGIVLDDRYEDQAVVWKVIRRSPAFYAGLRAGDVITAINGQRVVTRADVVRLVTKFDDEPLVVEVNRADRVRRIEVDVTPVPTRDRVVEPLPQPLPPGPPPATVVPPAQVPPPAAAPNPEPDRRGLLPRLRRRQ